MVRIAAIVIFSSWIGTSLIALHAQDAAPPTVDLQPQPSPSPSAVATPADIPNIPELSKLDEAFKQTSLGKAADDYRIRVECRKLQNQVANESEVVAAREAAEAAHTDLEKRERLRNYYNIYYGRMQRLASNEEMRKALEAIKAEHLKVLDQPRVRPVPGGTIPPVPKHEKVKRSRQ